MTHMFPDSLQGNVAELLQKSKSFAVGLLSKMETYHMTPEKVISRSFALLSGTLTTLACKAIGKVSWLQGSGTGTFDAAILYTLSMLPVFCALTAIQFQHKEAFANVQADETKDGVTGLTRSELALLVVNEGVINLTGAISCVLPGMWFGLLPSLDRPVDILVVFGSGSIFLIFGEFLQLKLTKDSKAEFIVTCLNGVAVGSVSWWVGYAMSNYTQNKFGAPDGVSSWVDYWMWLFALLMAFAMMLIINLVSAKLQASILDATIPIPKFAKNSDANCKPYGHVIFSMLKGVPVYSSGLILRNVTVDRNAGDYAFASFRWIVTSTVAVVFFESFIRMQSEKLCCRFADGKLLETFHLTQAVSLLSQSFAFVCGQLAFFALPDAGSLSNIMWIVVGALILIVGFLVESARTRWLPGLFKVADSFYIRLADNADDMHQAPNNESA